MKTMTAETGEEIKIVREHYVIAWVIKRIIELIDSGVIKAHFAMNLTDIGEAFIDVTNFDELYGPTSGELIEILQVLIDQQDLIADKDAIETIIHSISQQTTTCQ